MLGWCLWLLGTWCVTLLRVSPVPGVRLMILSSLVGVMLVWPAFRLSQGREGPGGRGIASTAVVMIDWWCLMLIFQAVIWPLRVVAAWSYAQAFWLDAAVLAWSLLVGAIVAAGRLFGSGLARSLAMAACVLLLVGEPLLMALTQGRWTMRVSPLQAIWELSRPAIDADPARAQPLIIAAGVAAGAAWLAVVLLTAGTAVRPRVSATSPVAPPPG